MKNLFTTKTVHVLSDDMKEVRTERQFFIKGAHVATRVLARTACNASFF